MVLDVGDIFIDHDLQKYYRIKKRDRLLMNYIVTDAITGKEEIYYCIYATDRLIKKGILKKANYIDSFLWRTLNE